MITLNLGHLEPQLNWAAFASPRKWVAVFAMLMAHGFCAQQERVVSSGFNSWYATHLESNVARNVTLFGQCHIRRTDFGSEWQQRLLFLGSQWQSPAGLKWSFAYGNIMNHPNGIPAQEHRLFEQLVYAFPAGKWSIGHRHRLEHQWLEQKDFDLRNRYRIDISAKRPMGTSGKWTFRAHNESLIAMFDRTTAVIYQQNWLGLGLIHAFSANSTLSLEYLQQFIVSGNGLTAKRNHNIHWMFIHKLDFSRRHSHSEN